MLRSAGCENLQSGRVHAAPNRQGCALPPRVGDDGCCCCGAPAMLRSAGCANLQSGRVQAAPNLQGCALPPRVGDDGCCCCCCHAPCGCGDGSNVSAAPASAAVRCCRCCSDSALAGCCGACGSSRSGGWVKKQSARVQAAPNLHGPPARPRPRPRPPRAPPRCIEPVPAARALQQRRTTRRGVAGLTTRAGSNQT